MPLGKSLGRRRLAALSGVAAASLAVAGLAFTSPTAAASAAPSAPAAPTKLGYTGAPVNPAPYTLTQPDGTTLQVHGFGDHLANGVATVKGNYTLVKGSDGFWRYAAGLTASGKLKPSSVVAGKVPLRRRPRDWLPRRAPRRSRRRRPEGRHR